MLFFQHSKSQQLTQVWYSTFWHHKDPFTIKTLICHHVHYSCFELALLASFFCSFSALEKGFTRNLKTRFDSNKINAVAPHLAGSKKTMAVLSCPFLSGARHWAKKRDRYKYWLIVATVLHSSAHACPKCIMGRSGRVEGWILSYFN
jgi:hypothetical protein